MPSRIAPILVAACGNPDAADDAFGPNVIAALSGTNSSPPCKQGGEIKRGAIPLIFTTTFHRRTPMSKPSISARTHQVFSTASPAGRCSSSSTPPCRKTPSKSPP